MSDLYTTHDVSRMLHVDASTVSKWIDKGILLAYRTPGGHRRVRSTDLRTFLVAHQMPLPEELGTGTVHLIVIDDEKQVLEGLRRALKPFSSQVQLTLTTSGVEGLLMVSEQKPHGLLVDLTMPDLDGLEVCRAIRARKSLEGVRIITMTGRHSPDTVQQSLKAGAAACIAKPLDVQQILELFRVPIGLSVRS